MTVTQGRGAVSVARLLELAAVCATAVVVGFGIAVWVLPGAGAEWLPLTSAIIGFASAGAVALFVERYRHNRELEERDHRDKRELEERTHKDARELEERTHREQAEYLAQMRGLYRDLIAAMTKLEVLIRVPATDSSVERPSNLVDRILAIMDRIAVAAVDIVMCETDPEARQRVKVLIEAWHKAVGAEMVRISNGEPPPATFAASTLLPEFWPWLLKHRFGLDDATVAMINSHRGT